MNKIVAKVIIRDKLLYIDMIFPEFYKQVYNLVHSKEDLGKGIYEVYDDL